VAHKLDPLQFGGDEAKCKLFEQKRRNLIEEVKSVANKTPEVSGKRVLDERQAREEATAKFTEQVDRAERENMEQMQRAAKKDVQKVVIQELEAKLNDHKSQKKQQESVQRLEQLMKKRDEEMKARKKEATKRQEKNSDVRERSMHAKAEKGEEMTEALRKASERAEKKLSEIFAAHEEAKARNDERMAHIVERQEGKDRQLLRGREEAYREHVAKHHQKLEKLAEKLAHRQSHAEEIAEKQQQTTLKVREFQENKQAKVEENYWNICARHDRAATKRADNLEAQVKEYTVKNGKRKQAHASRYDRLLEELDHKMSASLPGSPTYVRPGSKESMLSRSTSDSHVFEAAEHRRRHVSLVDENRERLRRAHHYEVEEQLHKLEHMRKRVQIMEDSKSEADKRRMVVMRNCAVEKMHLSDKVDRMRDSQDPEKMYRMLDDLDPDREAVVRIGELLKSLGMDHERLVGFKDTEEETK